MIILMKKAVYNAPQDFISENMDYVIVSMVTGGDASNAQVLKTHGAQKDIANVTQGITILGKRAQTHVRFANIVASNVLIHLQSVQDVDIQIIRH